MGEKSILSTAIANIATILGFLMVFITKAVITQFKYKFWHLYAPVSNFPVML